MNQQEAIDLARDYFLSKDRHYGCAETSLMVLSKAFGLPDAEDSSPALALNGGVAWSGGICGAISGAAIAVGRLAATRIDDYEETKRVTRRIIMRHMEDFRREFGDVNCRSLIDMDISTDEGHAAFIEGKSWHTICMGQLEFTIGKLLELQHEQAWNDRLQQIAGLE